MDRPPYRLPLKEPVPNELVSPVPRYRLRRRRPPLISRGALPVPLRLPLLHALLSFIFIALLPQHPLSIPTALGAAFLVVFYILFFALRAGLQFETDEDDRPPWKEAG